MCDEDYVENKRHHANYRANVKNDHYSISINLIKYLRDKQKISHAGQKRFRVKSRFGKFHPMRLRQAYFQLLLKQPASQFGNAKAKNIFETILAVS